MLNWLLNQLSQVPSILVYVVVGGLVFAEAALLIGFVLPAELAVIAGGVLAHGTMKVHSSVDLFVLMAVVVSMAIVGDSTGYAIGHHYGERILNLPLLRTRRGLLDWVLTFLRTKGVWAVFLGRFTAFLRAMVPGLSGISRMHYRTFLVANAAGGLVWGAGFTYLGYLAGNAYQRVEQYSSIVGYVILGLVVVGGITVHTITKRKEAAIEAAFEEREAMAAAHEAAEEFGAVTDD